PAPRAARGSGRPRRQYGGAQPQLLARWLARPAPFSAAQQQVCRSFATSAFPNPLRTEIPLFRATIPFLLLNPVKKRTGVRNNLSWRIAPINVLVSVMQPRP
ncbi:hypothetical protein, partial [Paenibacillus graminis]|uniref:hypothetical protein n=1 Tax=Paenibacillus graminis TaxID=189425 RepID=UPI002DBAC0B5